MISPTFMYELLKILPGVIGKVDPKKKDTAKLLDAIFKLPDMFGGALKSSSTGTKIGKGIASEADSLTDIFTSPYSSGGLANTLQIGGDPTQPGLFKPLGPLSGIGAGWGM